MMDSALVLDWINRQIPNYLDQFTSYKAFNAAMPGAATSGDWKIVAYAMAAVKWHMTIKHIPR
jgi:hypothetical protein